MIRSLSAVIIAESNKGHGRGQHFLLNFADSTLPRSRGELIRQTKSYHFTFNIFIDEGWRLDCSFTKKDTQEDGMSEDLNNNLHRTVQEDLVPLGVERFMEGSQVGLNSIRFRGLFQWVREHAVQSTVGGFVIGYLLGSFLRREHSTEAL
jgi:hypothetical protein